MITMSNIDQTQDENKSEEVTELSLLKQRASMMGIVFSNNIGIEKLRERVNEKLAEEVAEEKPVLSLLRKK
jgi:selenocysteine-specific translation elongation factor